MPETTTSAPGSFAKLMTTPRPARLPSPGLPAVPKQKKAKQRQPMQVRPEVNRPVGEQTEQSLALPTPQSTNQPISQSVSRPVDQSVDQQLTGKVVNRPVAFYLPEIINEKIDEAVDYMEKRHRVKVDRSAVVSAILGNPTLWEPEALTQLVDQAVSQLTSRLTTRLTKL